MNKRQRKKTWRKPVYVLVSDNGVLASYKNYWDARRFLENFLDMAASLDIETTLRLQPTWLYSRHR
ncbi:MAG: hypothetical protein EOO38_06000 [Cytophagaceae bacterium]|nr:MAG: hypothetical protein EOO38_06000 [Cytophagaceae bacterium]